MKIGQSSQTIHKEIYMMTIYVTTSLVRKSKLEEIFSSHICF